MGRSGRRLGSLLLGAVAFSLALALLTPASAFAHTSTRIVVVKSTVVDWSTPGVVPTAPVVTAKLQKKTSSGWVSLKGTVKISVSTSARPSWTLLGSHYGSSHPVTLQERGKYRIAYAGSSKYKSCTAYTTRLDMIGDTVSVPRVTFDHYAADWVMVNVDFDVNWNTEAFPHGGDDPLTVAFIGGFISDTTESGTAMFVQQVLDRGTYSVTYRVAAGSIPLNASYLSILQLETDDSYLIVEAGEMGEELY